MKAEQTVGDFQFVLFEHNVEACYFQGNPIDPGKVPVAVWDKIDFGTPTPTKPATALEVVAAIAELFPEPVKCSNCGQIIED